MLLFHHCNVFGYNIKSIVMLPIFVTAKAGTAKNCSEKKVWEAKRQMNKK